MQNIHSHKRKILNVLVVLVLTFVIFTCSVVGYIFYQETKKQELNTTKIWAQHIADRNSQSLSFGQTSQIESDLNTLNNVEFINHVHIYPVDDTQETELETNEDREEEFINYNRKGLFSLLSKLNEMPSFLPGEINNSLIEYFTPITFQNKTVGYLYIQTQSVLASTLNTVLFWLLALLLISSLLAFMFGLRLDRFSVFPMEKMVEQTQKISQLKDFSLRFESMPYKELDIVARNLNILLQRTEKHVANIAEASIYSEKQNQELEEKVNKRTAALKDSNQELLSTLEKLHQFQNQLVESEKMASLGDMVAGVAHEVNTPIGLGVTASTLLSDRIKEIKQAFDDKTLKSSHLKRFLVEGEENVGIIYRNLHRAADLISSFKKVSVDQSSEEVSVFNVKTLLDEILLTLAPKLKNTPYIITLNCDESLTISSKPGPINQILINLILNSILHGFEDRDHGKIDISILSLNQELQIKYQDDGMGLDESIKHKIFEPFTTTKRGAGGSGLGLHLVYNLVTQALGGNIDFNSEAEQGVTFDIKFPLQQYESS